MRILSIGNFGTGWDGSICDEEHIAGALEELGHEVTRLQRGDKIPLTNGPGEPYYKFILVSQWDGYDTEWLHRTKRYFLCPLVYWAFDYQANGQEWHERLIEESDLYLSKRIADSKYPNWQWLSQDFSPSFLDKYLLPIEKDIDVLFTGSYLPWATERNDTVKAVNEKFNLVVHSVNDWPFLERRPPIMDEGLPELYARAKIVLSIDHTLEAGYWSDRNAQIMACGVRPLFRYIPLSEARFGDRVDYFYSIDDCLSKINWRLNKWFQGKTNADGLYVQDRVKDLLTIVESIL